MAAQTMSVSSSGVFFFMMAIVALSLSLETFSTAFSAFGAQRDQKDARVPQSGLGYVWSSGNPTMFSASESARLRAPVGFTLLGATVVVLLQLAIRSGRVGKAVTAVQPLPGQQHVVSMRAFEGELGVQAPVGYFDPLGLSADGDKAIFLRRRETEIKHGRISMLATMGYITPELTGKFPGYLSPSAELKFVDIPNGLAAVSKVPAAGWAQILAYMAFCEISGMSSRTDAPGNFGFKPPLLTSADPAVTQKRLASELANGRLAMMAIIGMFFQDGLTGSAYGDWALYTASPLRAFESELMAA